MDYLEEHVHAGMKTSEIDKIVYDMTTEMGGIPAPLNYNGFPYSVCTSVNEQVCHGFPSEDVVLKEGDIVKLYNQVNNYWTEQLINNKRK